MRFWCDSVVILVMVLNHSGVALVRLCCGSGAGLFGSGAVLVCVPAAALGVIVIRL